LLNFIILSSHSKLRPHLNRPTKIDEFIQGPRKKIYLTLHRILVGMQGGSMISHELIDRLSLKQAIKNLWHKFCEIIASEKVSAYNR